jgi:hypothetical protein
MAIIYSYPLTTNILATDVIVGTTTTLAGGRPRNQTKSFEIGDLATYFASVIVPPGTYVPYNGATGPVNLGAYDLTLNSATIGRGGGQIYSNIVFGLSSLLNNTTGQNNTYLGFSSGYYNTIGSYNTAIGTFASQFTTTGNYNTAIGNNALYTNTTGSYNLAIGSGALFSNTTGSNNIAIGYATQTQSPGDNNSIVIGSSATGVGSNTVVLGNSSVTTTRLRGNVQGGAFIKDGGTNLQYLLADGSVTTGPVVTGFVPYTGATQAVNLGAFNLTVNSISVGKGSGSGAANTVVGNLALSSATTGFTNTAFGSGTLKSVTTGYENVAIGYNALTNGISFTRITAIGWAAGENHTSSIGSGSVYMGWSAGKNSTSAYNCTFIGANAAVNNTTGNWNTGIGESCMQYATTGAINTTVGVRTLLNNTTGSFNVAIGGFAANYVGSGTVLNTISNNSVFIGANTRALNDNETNQIVIGDAAVGAGSNTATLGNTSITTTRLRGTVQGGSFVKDGGTVSQYLMADGSVTTSGPLFKAASSTTATGVITVISSAIGGSLFSDGSILKIQTMVTFPNQTLNITPITYYINTSPSIVGATQIAIYDVGVGQRYAWMDRSFWSIGGTFNSRNFGNSSQTSVSNSGSVLGSTSIPATFYIIATINVGAGDLGTIASILIEKQ